jgi:uncharacterized membrane protein (DUF106 family)
MNDKETQGLIRLLEEIRDNQKVQLDRQSETLSLQREQFSLVQRQHERAERIQDRTEQIQDKGAQIVATSRKAMFLILPILVVLILYVSWILFRDILR